MGLEEVGGLVSHGLEGVAPFDQRQALGQEPLQFDRADLRAVLLTLAALLRLFVVVELAFDPLAGAVEQLDGGPEQVVEIGLQAGVAQGGDQGVEDVGQCALDPALLGQGPWVGLILEGTVAVELEFGEERGGRGCRVGRFVIGRSVLGVMAA